MSPTFKRFLHYVRPYWGRIIGAVLAGELKFGLALLLPWALGRIIDDVPHIKITHDYTQLWEILALLLIAFVFRGIGTYYRSMWSEVTGGRIVFDIRRDLYQHLQRLGLAYHAKRRVGQSTARLINDLNNVEGLLERSIVSISIDLILLGGVVLLLLVLDWKLCVVSMFTLPMYGFVFRHYNPRIREVSTAAQSHMEELSGEVTEKLAGLPVVISFVREKTEAIRFFHQYRRYFNVFVKRLHLRILLISIAEFLQSFGPILVIVYGGYRVVTEDTFTLGQLVAFNGYLSHLYLPTRRLADYSAEVQEKLAALDRVFEVMDNPPEIQEVPDAPLLQNVQGHVEFQDVHFAYRENQPVLNGISFSVEPGKSVALVGRSGSGKTTLVNLIPRFYDVLKGTVRVDGCDIRQINLHSLRENIGIVHQDPILFSGSIRNNILYGRHNATEAEMLEASRMAHVDEFVKRLPMKYDTIIGERGVALSGGQRQRISIARAFLRDPRILILDEATSNLDSAAEQIIQDALAELMRGRTTFVIAHRLSTVVDCDTVVVLEAGRIVQNGPHNQLIYETGPYRLFCEEQFGAIDLSALATETNGTDA